MGEEEKNEKKNETASVYRPPNVHPQLKKIKDRRQISSVNDVLSYSLNFDNLGWILTIQVRHQAKKAPDE